MKYKLISFTFLLIIPIVFISCSSEDNATEDKNDTLNIIDKNTIQIQPIVDTVNINSTNVDTLSLVVSEKKETVKVFKYICPLGDKEGNSDKEGICPACEMELIENPDYTK